MKFSIKNRFSLSIFAIAVTFVTGCSSVPKNSSPELQTVPYVDVERYLDKWYEIARYPHSFEEGCFGSTAFYEKVSENEIKVTNQCRQDGPDGKLDEAVGKAFIADRNTNAKLKVQFFWPFKGDYWIIDIDENYQHAIVSEPDRQYLWILSRNSKMNPSKLETLKEKLVEKGFDLTYLIMTPQ
jgi:apolipoprotein D and lipocalin family protein